MPQSLADVLLHIVFSTKERHPWIQQENELELYHYIGGLCRNLDCQLIQINGMADHIHLLLSLGRKTTVSNLISEIKSNSSRWIKSKGKEYSDFAWQGGYGAFSVSRPNMEGVVKYIAMQKEHHKHVSFKDELLQMLQRSQLKYDENYLWD